MQVQVDERIGQRHPDITQADVRCALANAVKSQPRLGTEPLVYAGVGPATDGRLLQWLAFRLPGRDGWYAYHCMRATAKVLRELGMKERRGMR